MREVGVKKARAARPNEMAARLLPNGAFPRQRIALDGAPVETVDAEVKDLEPSSWRVTGTESSKDSGHGEAKTYQRAADRNATRDAKAIKRPGAAEPLAAAR